MKTSELKNIIKRIFNEYLKKYFTRLLIALFLSLIVAATTSGIAWLLDPAIEKIFIEQDKKYASIIPIAIVLTFAAKGLALYFARSNVIKVGYWVCGELEKEMSKKILISDTNTIDNKHSAKFISNFLFDTQMVQQMVSTSTLNLMKDTLTLIALVSLMFYQNWKLALFAILIIPLTATLAKSLGKRISKAGSESMDLSARLSSFLSDIVRGSKIIKIYQSEEREQNRAVKSIDDLNNKLIKIGIIQIRLTPIMEALTGVMIAGFIYYSGILIAAGEIGINNFFSFLTAMMLAYQPVRALATIHMSFQHGAEGAKRIFSVIDQQVDIHDNSHKEKLNLKKAEIEFENVSFKYPTTKERAIKNINFKIKGGTMAAFVGQSGAGKSTIMSLIPRFYDSQSGKILIDGQNIYDVNLFSLRKNISLVSQDVILFDDTVRSNILYANPNATDDQIYDACKLAAAEEFIIKLPDGYDTKIGENGVKLSGGQKQRISIARAILKNSPIILLDEATSALDTESEKKVQVAIRKLTENRTTLVIAHRLSTVYNADTIFVVNNGNIVSYGTHKELIEKSLEYKSLYQKQLA